ncbi:MAG: hypothetical protein KC800_03195 [Candidatus Eremiobacteraeota bacterium]|nr:hypothetical protein [Candidatus Eremiobacteraeota bacterium]
MKEDSERIGRIEMRVEALQDGQAKLEKGQQNLEQRFERLSDDVTFVIQTLDRHHEEMKRYFGILIEQFRGEMEAHGEGYRANRDRLDDHEERIENLEAS